LGKGAVGTTDGRYTLLLAATAEKKGCGQQDEDSQKVAGERVHCFWGVWPKSINYLL
jgi:hypothetical protein